MSALIEGKDWRDRVESFLRDRHPVKTAAHVASETGCSDEQTMQGLET